MKIYTEAILNESFKNSFFFIYPIIFNTYLLDFNLFISYNYFNFKI